jgi:hypothetical protein
MKFFFQLAKVAAFAVFVVWGIYATAETLWWTNSKQSYPSFLVGSPPPSATDLLSLAKACGDPIEVVPEKVVPAVNGKVLVRCGSYFYWPTDVRVWRVPRVYVAQILDNQVK